MVTWLITRGTQIVLIAASLGVLALVARVLIEDIRSGFWSGKGEFWENREEEW